MTKPKLYFTNQTCDRQKARQIELKIEQATGLQLENPFYDGEAKEVAQLDSTGVSNISADEIVGMDLRKIRQADGVLALMTSDRDIGSCMEIAIAAECWGKEVYIIAMTEQHYSHPWLKHFACRMFKTPYEFIKFANAEWGNPNPVKESVSWVKKLWNPSV